MRSTLFHFSLLALPLALVSGVVVACGSTDRNAFGDAEAAGRPTPDMPPSTSFNSGDAGAPEKDSPSGSPLCGVTVDHCLPDDDGQTVLSPSLRACAEQPDAGGDTADGSTTPACRIVETNAGDYAPECKEGDRRGVDGVSCAAGSDCAPGFDCVDGEKGPVCRRYCCSGSCEAHTSQNGGPTFCDIQTLVDYRRDDVKAPVCMPVKTCKLLRQGECSDKETCAVINEQGDTGCVALGAAKAGEPCDKDHCALDLTCLGSLGNRRCYKLCRVDGADCEPTQICTTGSVFQDTTFGVCKDN